MALYLKGNVYYSEGSGVKRRKLDGYDICDVTVDIHKWLTNDRLWEVVVKKCVSDTVTMHDRINVSNQELREIAELLEDELPEDAEILYRSALWLARAPKGVWKSVIIYNSR